MSYKDEGDAGFHLQGLQFHPPRLPQFQIERGQRIVQQLPNAAEVAVAEVIRRHGHPGFEAALLAFLGRAVAPDNLLVLAHRAAAPPLVLFRQAAEAQLFAALAEAQWAGLPASDNVPEAGPVTRLVVALQRARGIRLSPRQAEVALLILRRHSTTSIALVLGVSAQTVNLFRRQLHARCGVSTRAELLALMLPLLGEGARV